MNYYTHLCFSIPGKRADLEKLAQIIEALDALDRNERLTATAPEICKIARRIFKNYGLSPMVEVVLHDNEIDIEDVGGEALLEPFVDTLQEWLKLIDSEETVQFEYARTASRATDDAYGGGAVGVTKNGAKYWDSSQPQSSQNSVALDVYTHDIWDDGQEYEEYFCVSATIGDETLQKLGNLEINQSDRKSLKEELATLVRRAETLAASLNVDVRITKEALEFAKQIKALSVVRRLPLQNKE
jgi:hypothetical protein